MTVQWPFKVIVPPGLSTPFWSSSCHAMPS